MRISKLTSIIFFLLYSLLCSGQYLETFGIPNKGIISGPCITNDPTTCASFDFIGVNWTLGNNLAGVDSEGIKTIPGNALEFADIDELVCWTSPLIDISAVASASLAFTVEFFGTWTTTDFGGEVSYIVDGGAPTVIGPVMCGTNTFGGGCDMPDGTFTANASGIVGNEMTITGCFDANTTSEIVHIKSVSVPEAGVILPVVWDKFNAINTKDGNLLQWSTTSEINNEKYEIERSAKKSNDFNVIATIKGKGNSSKESQYSYTDEDISSGTSYYYRIKQIDFDGHFEYSKVVSVKAKDKFGKNISLHPNPVSNNLNISLPKTSDEEVMISVLDLTGRIIDQFRHRSNSNIDYDVSLLNSGIYILKITNSDGFAIGESIRFSKL